MEGNFRIHRSAVVVGAMLVSLKLSGSSVVVEAFRYISLNVESVPWYCHRKLLPWMVSKDWPFYPAMAKLLADIDTGYFEKYLGPIMVRLSRFKAGKNPKKIGSDRHSVLLGVPWADDGETCEI
ncbi:uncharacterized protein G2W53_017585 [Senna tora]|uniref:Uncharacterized protein n=1 Tax=Senna tora TaxID=362788 RepID=A0A834TT15_9FABA|nr:uncharacterized protein G2W53_017585 [Senna tora]